MTSKSWSHDLCVVIKFRAKQKRKKITTLTIYSNNWFLWVLFVYARGAPWVQYNMHFTVKKKTHRKKMIMSTHPCEKCLRFINECPNQQNCQRFRGFFSRLTRLRNKWIWRETKNCSLHLFKNKTFYAVYCKPLELWNR